MKKLIIILFVLPFFVQAQNKTEEPKWGISFSGFVKNDFFWDSRQNVSIREGHFLLYPSPVLADAEGKDINEQPSFNFLSIQSRLTGKITGPDAFGAKTSGVMEADFFGNENTSFSDVNGFRLRHAYAKLNWKKDELLFGQYWHPMFAANCFPGVVSFNTGSPFMPFSRNPQMRYTHKMNDLSLVIVANAQRDFVSPGGSSAALRNAVVPEMNVQFIYNTKNDSAKTEFLAGIGAGYKVLNPRLYSEVTTTTSAAYYSLDTTSWTVTYHPAVTSTKKYKTDEEVSGYTTYAFVKYKLPNITMKLYGVYGQNLFDVTMIGGYAINRTTNVIRDFKEYTPLKTMSAWTELQTNGSKFQAGIFAGYTQNLGADSTILSYSTTNRGADIRHIYRVSPRLVFIAKKFQFMSELEYTTAAYMNKDELGNYNRDANGVITGWDNVSNLRFLFSVMYSF